MTGGGHTEIYGSGTTPKTSDSQRMILVKILTATTSGGAVGGNIVGNYGGVAPVVTPTGPTWAEDTSTGKLWFYNGTTWIDTGITI